MNKYAILQKETEIDFMKLDYEIFLESAGIHPIYESGDKQNIFDKAITTIKNIIEKVKRKLQEIFTGKKYDETEKKLKDALAADPSLKNKKVKIRDQKKMEKLTDETIGKIKKAKTKKELDATMESYRKKKKIIAGAVITVSVVTLAGLVLHSKKKGSKELDKVQEKATEVLQRVKEEDNKELTKIQLREKTNVDKSKGYDLDRFDRRIPKVHSGKPAPKKPVEKPVAPAAKSLVEQMNATSTEKASAVTEVVKDATQNFVKLKQAEITKLETMISISKDSLKIDDKVLRLTQSISADYPGKARSERRLKKNMKFTAKEIIRDKEQLEDLKGGEINNAKKMIKKNTDFMKYIKALMRDPEKKKKSSYADWTNERLLNWYKEIDAERKDYVRILNTKKD